MTCAEPILSRWRAFGLAGLGDLPGDLPAALPDFLGMTYLAFRWRWWKAGDAG